MEPQYERVRYDIPGDRIARVTLARPEKRNAQDYKMLYELDDAFMRAVDDDDIRVIILAADGPHFSAGHDQTERGEHSDIRPVGTERGWTKPGIEGGYALGREVYFDTHWRWRNIPKPIIAQAQGKAVGAGMMLLWVCDIIIASEEASFADPVVHIGCNGVEYFAHPWEFGARKAKELLFTSDWLSAEEARQCGMVNQVVPLDQLSETTLAMAGRIAKQPSIGLKLAKEAVNGMLDIQGQYNALREGHMLCTIGHAQLRMQGLPKDGMGEGFFRHKEPRGAE
jgi:enoyl-CoA hydratase